MGETYIPFAPDENGVLAVPEWFMRERLYKLHSELEGEIKFTQIRYHGPMACLDYTVTVPFFIEFECDGKTYSSFFYDLVRIDDGEDTSEVA